jgi:polyhydroxyalkanoate synthesis regulator phasin
MNANTVHDETNGEPEGTGRYEPRSSAERLVLAGIGAVASALDRAEQQFDHYVDRGKEVRDELQERGEEIRQQRWTARSRARDCFRGTMDLVLDTLNVPSRTDVETINVKLNILTRKLDDLQMPPVNKTATPGPPTTGDSPPTGDLST